MITQVHAHWLKTHCFCEYQLYMIERAGVADPGSRSIDRGNAAHGALDTRHNATATLVDSLESAILVARVTNKPFIIREAYVKSNRVSGVIDQLEYHLTKVVIVDDKIRTRSGEPYDSDKLQVLAYCLAFSEQFDGLGLPIYAVIHDENTEQVLWEHEFDQSDKIEVNSIIDRILDVVNGVCQPIPNKNLNKCRGCRFNMLCPKSLVRR